MKKDAINESEAMQEGLERFLQNELEEMLKEENKKSTQPYQSESKKTDMIYGEKTSGNTNIPYGNETTKDIDMLYGNEQPGNINMRYRIEPQEPVERVEGEGKLKGTKRYTDRPLRDEKAQRTSADDAYRERTDRRKEYTNTNRTATKGTEADYKSKGGRKDQSMSKRKKRKKSKFKRFLFGLLVFVLIIGGIWYFLVGSVYNQMDYKREETLVSEPMKEDGVTNILLIGNDSREEGDDGRSDAMILLSISNKTKTIHMTSLLRDMYVEIPGREGNRLNAAYAYGGPALLLDTIEQNLGITVNRYVLVNFQAFASLVDAVGGVDLELTNEEVKWVNAYLNEYNLLEGRDITTDYLDESLSGMIHLNGPQALAYCRNRYIGSDFERTNRQRKVLTAITEKLPASVATNSKELIGSLFPHLTTNMTQSECYSLSFSASKFLTYDIIQSSIPIEGSYKNATIRSMSVLEVDYEMNKAYIRQNIYGE